MDVSRVWLAWQHIFCVYHVQKAHLHGVVGGGGQQGEVEVKVSRLQKTSLVAAASGRDPHHNLEHVCAAKGEELKAALEGFA